MSLYFLKRNTIWRACLIRSVGELKSAGYVIKMFALVETVNANSPNKGYLGFGAGCFNFTRDRDPNSNVSSLLQFTSY